MSTRTKPDEDGQTRGRKRRIVPPPVNTDQPNIYKYGLRTPRRTGEGEADAPSAATELDRPPAETDAQQNGANTHVTRVNGDIPAVAVPAPRATNQRTPVPWSVVLAPLWYPAWLTWLCCYTVFSALTYWDTVLLLHLHHFYRYTLGARDRARDYQPTQLGRTLLLALLAAALLWSLLLRPGHANTSGADAGTVHALHELEAVSAEVTQLQDSTRELFARLESAPSAARVQLLEEHLAGLDQRVTRLGTQLTGLSGASAPGPGASASEELLRDMSVAISTLQTSLANTAHSLEDKVTILTERLAGLSLSLDALTARVQHQTEALRAQLLADEQLHALIDRRIQLRLDAEPSLHRPAPVPDLTREQVTALVEDEIARELTAFMNERVQTLVDATLRDLRSEVQQQLQAESRASLARESELSSALVERLTQLIGERLSHERATRVERGSGEGVDRAWIEEQIRRALHRHVEGDVTARTDYALLAADAQLYAPLTHYAPLPLPESRAGSWLASVLGTAPRVRTPHGPRVAIHRSGPRAVGECWGFGGARANLTVKLGQPITISHVTIDHLARDIAYNIASAPRQFQIWAVNVTRADPEHSPRTLLGSFEYDVDGEPVQTFALPNTALATQYVQLSIASNHGHHYTCLYRFRVHGTPLQLHRAVN